jgi:hypothetical protein
MNPRNLYLLYLGAKDVSRSQNVIGIGFYRNSFFRKHQFNDTWYLGRMQNVEIGWALRETN